MFISCGQSESWFEQGQQFIENKERKNLKEKSRTPFWNCEGQWCRLYNFWGLRARRSDENLDKWCDMVVALFYYIGGICNESATCW